MLVSTQHQKGLEQKIFCKQMLVKFVIYISPCQYAEFMAAQTVQSGKAYCREGIQNWFPLSPFPWLMQNDTIEELDTIGSPLHYF